jgi:hypothetical protein
VLYEEEAEFVEGVFAVSSLLVVTGMLKIVLDANAFSNRSQAALNSASEISVYRKKYCNNFMFFLPTITYHFLDRGLNMFAVLFCQRPSHSQFLKEKIALMIFKNIYFIICSSHLYPMV